ncbi:MAG: PQQ-binding-like beta-propeller repeat protein [Anaerolineae bacterium]|nr:PQQ-binding-like beta-propeller repeat protein [Thermoflexales bacterium]MDW8406243.1 PQQ-binding-like beta-propeller repeat protein [Anaerolineae bacterium]
MQSQPRSPSSESRARVAQDLAGLAILFACIVVIGAAFWQPWLPPPDPAGTTLDQYIPAANGDVRLLAVYDAAGQISAWSSHNVVVLPALRGMTYDLGLAIGGAILERYAPPTGDVLSVEWLRDLQLIEARSRMIDKRGVITSTTAVYVREPAGQFLVAVRDMTHGLDLVFSPFIQAYPANLTSGSTWNSEGVASGGLTYRFEGRVVQAGPFQNAAARYEDCLQVETRLSLMAENGWHATTTVNEWLCAGVGVVEHVERDSGGGIMWRRILSDAAPLAERYPPPAALLKETPPLADAGRWRLNLFARANLSGVEFESSIPPTWLPLDPPLVLTAGYNGDLLAFTALTQTGALAWRFHTDGTIYSPPAFDPLRTRIYFGATNKRLYALDARGIFLWSFATGDNVATRPLVVSDTVIFGSEDRHVYALNADAGTLRWRAELGAAVVSAPALAGDAVIVGCDDGGVYALDVDDGELLWETGIDSSDSFIEAPVTTVGNRAFVASSAGTLAALDSTSGEVIWTASLGAGIRNAPAIGNGIIAVIDQAGRLTALNAQDGRRLWRDETIRYSGAPLIIDTTVLAIDRDGVFHLLDQAGRRLQQWATAEHITAAETGNRFDFIYGATIGGEAIWAINAKALVWRLGP